MIPRVRTEAASTQPTYWIIAGYVLLFMSTVFVGRIVYEETYLTWTNGPQMVGFAMMHGSVPFILLAGLIGLPGSVLWTIVSVVRLFRNRFALPLVNWVPITLLPLVVTLIIIPQNAVEEFTVQLAGPGSHGSDFLVEATANGNRRFVTRLLHMGYSPNYEDNGGTTPLSGAAVEGKEDMVGFLASRGADVNRPNRLSGETPLMASSEMGKLETAKALLANGADPCRTNKEGRTAAGLAKKYGHNDVAEYLHSKYSCQEKELDTCADTSTSVCVGP
jgi:Ankyrin repeats (many copies)